MLVECATAHESDQPGSTGGAVELHALVQEDDTWFVLDLASGSRRALATSQAFEQLPDGHRWLLVDRPVVSAGSFAFDYPYVLDLAQGRAVGPYDGFALAVSSDGRALFAADPREIFDIMTGPLRWLELPPAP